MSNAAHTLISGATLCTPEGLLPQGTLVLGGGKIQDVLRQPPASMLLNQDNVTLLRYGSDVLITPGLIDLQLNGALGCDFNHTSISEVLNLLAALPRFGITGILAALVSNTPGDMLSAINTVEEVIHFPQPHQTRILGLHLEGPFLNPERCGAHPADVMSETCLETASHLRSPSVKLWTLAPEMDPKGELTQYLTEQGVSVFAGHTQANLNELETVRRAGLKGFTHLFNAMASFHHRQPGIVAPALLDDTLYTSLIADGYHLHPNTLRMVQRLKPQNRMVVVSDAMALAGQLEGDEVQFAGQPAMLKNGQALNPQGTLAGSATLLDAAFRNLAQWDIAPVDALVQWMTQNPAEVIGMEAQYGRLRQGALADFVVWDRQSLTVQQTWIGGVKVYDVNETQAFQPHPTIHMPNPTVCG